VTGGTSSTPPKGFQLQTSAVAEAPGCPAALELSNFAEFNWGVQVVPDPPVVIDACSPPLDVSVVFTVDTTTGADKISVPNQILSSEGRHCDLTYVARLDNTDRTDGEWCPTPDITRHLLHLTAQHVRTELCVFVHDALLG
jgi:hypothetical protein